jgi:hypothetical protein
MNRDKINNIEKTSFQENVAWFVPPLLPPLPPFLNNIITN